jgi:hypothetical protein
VNASINLMSIENIHNILSYAVFTLTRFGGLGSLSSELESEPESSLAAAELILVLPKIGDDGGSETISQLGEMLVEASDTWELLDTEVVDGIRTGANGSEPSSCKGM